MKRAPWGPLDGPLDRPLVWAHRGASADAPANTCRAIELARVQGADGVELDLHPCATGEIVIFHDFDLATLGLRQPLRALSLAALRTFDLGAGARIPTLEEALEAARPALRVNLELKSHRVAGEGLEAAVARSLRRVAFPLERVLLSSFNPLSLVRAAVAMPAVASALLLHAKQSPRWRRVWPALLRPTWRLRTLPRLVALHLEHTLCDATSVAHAHAAGLFIQAWTVDEPTEMARLWGLGVRGIITNRPARLRALLEGRLARSGAH